jgi:hypothetical protein
MPAGVRNGLSDRSGSFLEYFAWAVAMFDQHDGSAAGASGAYKLQRVFDECFGPINRSATLSVEHATLDVDDEKSSVLHWLEDLTR